MSISAAHTFLPVALKGQTPVPDRPPTHAALSAAAPWQWLFRAFDCRAAIYTDSHSFAELFQHRYRRMVSTACLQDMEPRYGIFTAPENPWGTPVVVLDREVWPMAHPALLEWFAAEAILRDVLRRVRTHFLVHAGAVAHRGRALVLLGDSMWGKTTLVLELLRRGFHLLSDDLAAIERSRSRVHAFPRGLQIRPETLELLGIQPPGDATMPWTDKLVVDVEALFPGQVAAEAELTYVVALSDPDAPSWEERARAPLQIWMEWVPAALRESLNAHPHVHRVEQRSLHGFPLLRVHTREKHAVLAQVEELAARHRAPILNVWQWEEHRPSFTGPARLQEARPSELIPDILQRLHLGTRSAVLEAHRHRSLSLTVELLERLAQARSFRLQVGPVKAMADLLGALF